VSLVAIRSRWALAASLLAPPRCGVCGSPCAHDRSLCGRCDRSVREAVPIEAPVAALETAWSAAPYEGVPRDLVAALKFRRLMPLARRAAEAIAAGAPAGLVAGDLVSVPPAPWRLRARGLDAAEEIAVALAQLNGTRLVRCLARAEGPRQVGRPRSERLAEPPRVKLIGAAPPTAVLVDDVATTGATLSACARALRAGGARRVVGVTFARSLGRAPLA
jgi:predicted amidophosphoribosyltransferase